MCKRIVGIASQNGNSNIISDTDHVDNFNIGWWIINTFFHDYHNCVHDQRISCPVGSYCSLSRPCQALLAATAPLFVLDGDIRTSSALVLLANGVTDLFVLCLLKRRLVVLRAGTHELLLDIVDTCSANMLAPSHMPTCYD